MLSQPLAPRNLPACLPEGRGADSFQYFDSSSLTDCIGDCTVVLNHKTGFPNQPLGLGSRKFLWLDVQEKLARRGLKDPWGRNEAWRYMGGYAKPVTLLDVATKGLKWGFAAFVIALGIEYALYPPKKNGGHH
ncbi:NADH dehydrogenase [ubiquinone] 1 beta subcomplex subunit 3 [Alligator mississippiensis]|uniref:NADH dehydrogenase [ubiquinone] 1 beta subcomplex subunit 3 n=1 Tax=Alligator mississippiensis TaxID=8496 RepID=A0A151N9V2_ALLMI|nr:NADH dehydrogenase [ubiquinone] 1 beta subcomplex subunit 3 [Alligator mississippiensis]